MSQQFVALQQTDDAILYVAFLLDDAGAPITTGVTVDVEKPDGTFAAQDVAATLEDALTGEWRYIVPKAQVDLLGVYEITWKWTVGSTAREHRVLGPRARHI